MQPKRRHRHCQCLSHPLKDLVIVSACGFDSIPADLGALYTASCFPAPAFPTMIESYITIAGGEPPASMRSYPRAERNQGTLHHFRMRCSRFRQPERAARIAQAEAQHPSQNCRPQAAKVCRLSTATDDAGMAHYFSQRMSRNTACRFRGPMRPSCGGMCQDSALTLTLKVPAIFRHSSRCWRYHLNSCSMH